jgi:Xaa-Pro aminopeptidase
VIKTADELALITEASRLADIGQAAVRAALRPGMTELELWAVAFEAMRELDGRAPHVIVDLMAGDRTVMVGEPPTDHVIEPGSVVLFDLAAQRRGYWSDSCATLVCGEPTDAHRERHTILREALYEGLAAARPGVKAEAVDSVVRERLAAAGLHCPHHTGHGVGAEAQEPPWFCPGEQIVLEEGMVIALEPGAYVGGFGMRLELLAVVEHDGARPLSTHSLNLTDRKEN